MGELSKEKWIEDIRDNLYAGNPHMEAAMNHDEWATFDIVKVPNAGSKPNVVRDRQTLPAPIKNRQDTVVKYEPSEFTTDPFHVPNLEQIQLTYNKRDSVMREHRMALNERIGTEALYNWAATGSDRIIRTSGAAGNSNGPGGNNKKKLTLNEVEAAWVMLAEDDFVMDDVYLELTPRAYMDLLEDPDVRDVRQMGKSGILADGVIDNIYGFNIFVRSKVPIYNNDSTPKKKDTEDSTASTDNWGFPFWARTAVSKALPPEGVDVFEKDRQPDYYGAILSGLVMHGASQLYKQQQGTGVIVQQA